MSKFLKFKYILLIIVITILSSCSHLASRELSEEQRYALQYPSEQNIEWLNTIAPKLIDWYLHQEALLLPQGHALTADEITIAQNMGVNFPEKIRVLVLEKFPFPDDPELAVELSHLGFNNPNVGGFTMGYVILIKPQYEGEKWLLAHESVHVAQRERMGTEAFIRQYLLELKTVGYRYSPLEIEADQLMAQYE